MNPEVGQNAGKKNPEERTATKLYSKPLFSKDLEDQFIEIIHTMEVKYFGLKR